MEKKEWFAQWFDSKYYHILYQNRDDQEAQRFITNIVTELKVPQNAKVLDLACGKGRHAIMLNKLGLSTTGLDLSPESIKHAKAFENDDLFFDTHDMREVYNSTKFEYIFNLFTSFGYFENQSDNSKVLESIATMLEDDGIVVIDFMNAKKVIKNLVASEQKELSGITFNITRKYNGEHIFKNIQFEAENESYDFTEKVQALTLQDFENLISATRLQIINIFGDYDLHEFNEDTSNRLIIVAQKQ